MEKELLRDLLPSSLNCAGAAEEANNALLHIAYLISSKISGRDVSLSFILSFMATIIVLALSSAPCLELFSAAPESKAKCIFSSITRIDV